MHDLDSRDARFRHGKAGDVTAGKGLVQDEDPVRRLHQNQWADAGDVANCVRSKRRDAGQRRAVEGVPSHVSAHEKRLQARKVLDRAKIEDAGFGFRQGRRDSGQGLRGQSARVEGMKHGRDGRHRAREEQEEGRGQVLLTLADPGEADAAAAMGDPALVRCCAVQGPAVRSLAQKNACFARMPGEEADGLAVVRDIGIVEWSRIA